MSGDWRALDADDFDLDQVKQDYDFAEWRNTERAGRSFWIGFAALLRSFERHTVIADRRVQRSDPVCDSASFRVEAADGSGFIALLRECDDVPSAHLALLGDLSTVMLTRLPSGDETGLQCGDVCFVDHQESPMLVLFTRYNLCVKVAYAYGPKASAASLALHIDGLLQQSPDPGAGGPRIDVFSVQGGMADSDEAEINLVVTAEDGLNWAARLACDSGQISRKTGRLHLKATQPQSDRISVHAISAGGKVSFASTGIRK